MPFRKDLSVFCSIAALLLFGGVDAVFSQSGGTSEGESRVVGSREPVSVYEGEWGRINCRRSVIEPPDWVGKHNWYLEYWLDGTEWWVQRGVNDVADLLRQVGLQEATVQSLMASATEVKPGLTRIKPSDEVVWELSPEMRKNLYPHLVKPQVGGAPLKPFSIWQGGFSKMAERQSGISPETIQLVEHLTYLGRGNLPLFGDVRLVMKHARDDAERLCFMKTLSREVSLQCLLDMEAADPRVEEIAAYWSAGGRNPGAAQFLAAARRNPQIGQLDIVHLLPPVPKQKLNSFSHLESRVGNSAPDCFYTAFSFFAESTSSRLFDSIEPILQERYERATRPWQFGDLILITSSTGERLHSCNYIAGEIVFTKNGKSHTRPWVFQRFDDVFAAYLAENSIKATFFRLKPEYRQ